MIMDKQNLFSEDQAVTVSAIATNSIDLGSESSLVQSINEIGNAPLVIQCTTTFAGGTSLKVDICNKAADTITDATESIIASAAIITASLTEGYQFRIGLPKQIEHRYLGVYYTVVGTMSAGAITAGIVLDQQTSN